MTEGGRHRSRPRSQQPSTQGEHRSTPSKAFERAFDMPEMAPQNNTGILSRIRVAEISGIVLPWREKPRWRTGQPRGGRDRVGEPGRNAEGHAGTWSDEEPGRASAAAGGWPGEEAEPMRAYGGYGYTSGTGDQTMYQYPGDPAYGDTPSAGYGYAHDRRGAHEAFQPQHGSGYGPEISYPSGSYASGYDDAGYYAPADAQAAAPQLPADHPSAPWRTQARPGQHVGRDEDWESWETYVHKLQAEAGLSDEGDADTVADPESPLPATAATIGNLARMVGKLRPGATIRLLGPDGIIIEIQAPGRPSESRRKLPPSSRRALSRGRGRRASADAAAAKWELQHADQVTKPPIAAEWAEPPQPSYRGLGLARPSTGSHALPRRVRPTPSALSGPPQTPYPVSGDSDGNNVTRLPMMPVGTAVNEVSFPWASSLPPDARRALLDELARGIHECAAGGGLTVLDEIYEGWRATGEIYSDPALLRAILHPDVVGDFGAVPESPET